MCKGKKVGERVRRAEVMKDFICWGREFWILFVGEDI